MHYNEHINRKEKGMEGDRIGLSEDQVKKVFTLRAQGKAHLAIAKSMNTSDVSIGRILARKIYPDVEIPENILKKVKSIGKVYPSRRAAKKPKTAKSRGEALALYVEACFLMREAQRDCTAYGINPDTLELLAVSTKDGV